MLISENLYFLGHPFHFGSGLLFEPVYVTMKKIFKEKIFNENFVAVY